MHTLNLAAIIIKVLSFSPMIFLCDISYTALKPVVGCSLSLSFCLPPPINKAMRLHESETSPSLPLPPSSIPPLAFVRHGKRGEAPQLAQYQ